MKHVKRKLFGKAQVWVSALLYLLISIIVVVLVLEAGLPLIQKMGDEAYYSKAKEDFSSIDKTIKEVSKEGKGSQRVVPLEIRKGELNVRDNQIYWEYETKAEILSHKTQTSQGNLVMSADADVNCENHGGYYIVKNTYLWLNLSKRGTETNYVSMNSSELINELRWMNKSTEGVFSFMLNNDSSTAYGNGYSYIEKCEHKMDKVFYKAKFYNVTAANMSYQLTFEMDSKSDYIQPSIKII